RFAARRQPERPRRTIARRPAHRGPRFRDRRRYRFAIPQRVRLAGALRVLSERGAVCANRSWSIGGPARGSRLSRNDRSVAASAEPLGRAERRARSLAIGTARRRERDTQLPPRPIPATVAGAG